jgi:hypothetical protein
MPIHKQLTAHASVEQLKKQAKDLLRALRANDAEAIARFHDVHPAHRANPSRSARTLVLADAQLILAREYGFESRPRFGAGSKRSISRIP